MEKGRKTGVDGRDRGRTRVLASVRSIQGEKMCTLELYLAVIKASFGKILSLIVV